MENQRAEAGSQRRLSDSPSCGELGGSPDTIAAVDPLLPEDAWDWFCLDGVQYHGRTLTIIWDRRGRKYRRGSGLRILADGQVIANGKRLRRLTGRLA